MITEHDLQAAIAECNGQRNPNASTCLKLAAYYTIYDKMFGEKNSVEQKGYSFENRIDEVTYLSNTEFSEAIAGRNVNELLPIWDELMSVLQATNPRLYNAVMRKITD